MVGNPEVSINGVLGDTSQEVGISTALSQASTHNEGSVMGLFHYLSGSTSSNQTFDPAVPRADQQLARVLSSDSEATSSE